MVLSSGAKTTKRFTRSFESLLARGGGLLPLAERELIIASLSTANGCGLHEINHINALAEGLGFGDPELLKAVEVHPGSITRPGFYLARGYPRCDVFSALSDEP